MPETGATDSEPLLGGEEAEPDGTDRASAVSHMSRSNVSSLLDMGEPNSCLKNTTSVPRLMLHTHTTRLFQVLFDSV
jgi:hypothetical protein